MKPFQKIAVIATGYVAAFVVGCAAVVIRLATTSDADAQASSGMYAFGDSVVFIAVFGVLAVVPTGAALFFLRPYSRFWKVLSAVSLVVAVSGVAAAILFGIGRHAVSSSSSLAALAGISAIRILSAPLLSLAFIVCAILSPSRAPRLALLTASAMEVLVSAYGGVVWFVPLLFHRP